MFVISAQANANINNYNPYKGWFWYQNPPKKVKTKKQEQESKNFITKTYTYKQLWNMYPDKFKKILNLALKQAVQYPTVVNVKQYMILQDIARRKAYAYSNVVDYIAQTDPTLNLHKDYPENDPGIHMRTGLINYDVSQALKNNINDYALLFFYEPGCQYCEIQSQIMKYLQDEDGWRIMPINITTHAMQAARFNVQTVPEIILIHKGSSQWIPVASGVTTVDTVEKNIYRGIMYFEGKISPQNWSMYQFQKSGGFNVNNYPVSSNTQFNIKVPK